MVDIDITLRIVHESIRFNKDTNTFVIKRIYSIPKPRWFKTPNHYIEAFQQYNNAYFCEKEFLVHTFLNGWTDADCRSYEMTLILKPFMEDE